MNEKAHPKTVRIHIDREPYESPNPTTGEALYALADVGKHRDLFREVDGDHEDELVPRDETEVRLKEDEHFYSQKPITLAVNGQKKDVTDTRLTFDQVAKLAFPVPPPGENILYVITFRHGPKQNPKGDLLEGGFVWIKKGMIFDVTATDRS